MAVDPVLLDIAPEMTSVDTVKRLRVISYAKAQVGFGKGVVRELAIAYLAAHMLTISTRHGNSGNVNSETEGSLSRSFGGNLSDDVLGTTSYGVEFVRLRRSCIFNPRVYNGGQG